MRYGRYQAYHSTAAAPAATNITQNATKLLYRISPFPTLRDADDFDDGWQDSAEISFELNYYRHDEISLLLRAQA